MGYAQQVDFDKKFTKNWSVGLNYGPTIYWGYFSDGKSISTAFQKGISFGYGVVLAKQVTPYIGISGQLLFGSIQGHKDFYGDGAPADLNFSSDLREANLSAKISLSNIITGYKMNRFLDVYALAGVGLSNFNGRIIHSTNGDTLFTMGNGTGHGINGWEVDGMVNLGVGASLKLNKHFALTAETEVKGLQTDKLGRVRGLIRYDTYSYSSIGITFKFGIPKESSSKQTPAVQTKPEVEKKETSTATPVKQPETKPVEEKKDVVAVDIPKEVVTKPVEKPKEVAPVVQKAVNQPAEEKPKETPAVKDENQLVDQSENDLNSDHYTGFKVQVIATRKTITIETVRKEYKLNEPIRQDRYGEWHGFSVGAFTTLNEAKAYSAYLKLHNHAKDSFVVKFKDGKRVGAIYR